MRKLLSVAVCVALLGGVVIANASPVSQNLTPAQLAQVQGADGLSCAFAVVGVVGAASTVAVTGLFGAFFLSMALHAAVYSCV